MARKIGDRIKELRTNKGLTQLELADKLGFTSQTISNWESGIREPDIDALSQLANLFNVSLDYLLLGKKDDTHKSMKCPMCGGNRFLRPHFLSDYYRESKITCVNCGYTFSLNHDIKISYFLKLRELNHILGEISSKESELKLYESKTEDVSRFKKDLKDVKKKRALLAEAGVEESKETRALDESIAELEEIIKRGKDDNAIRMINNLTFEIDKLTAQKNEILGRLRDPFKTDFDIIKETADKNLKSLEKEIIQELLNEEIDRYIDIASVTNKPRMVLLDDCLLENYDKFNSLLCTLRQKNYVIQLTNSELKADCILVENEERKKELGDKAITIKEFEERWGIKFNDQLFKITK